MDEMLILSTVWVPKDPVPCSDEPDLWSDGSVYSKSPARLNYAIEVCMKLCPVRRECLDAAMYEENMQLAHRYGIRGGMTPKQRAWHMKKQQRGLKAKDSPDE